jgi:G:T-mismatch repair DNA endonuclease (very short patch repair protein)
MEVKSKIKYNNLLFLSTEKQGRLNICYFENEFKINKCNLLNKQIEIMCEECKCWYNRKFYNALIDKFYVCCRCRTIGDKNPFYGKKHTKEFKDKLSLERKEKYIGSANPFYGKKHTKETVDKLSASSKIYNSIHGNSFKGKAHSIKTRGILREKSKKWAAEHPEHYVKMVESSLKKQSLGFKSSIEKSTEEELKRRIIDYKYNKILHRKYQYDFIIGDEILLEVHGDYWHANPLIYGDEPGKRKLNNTQEFKVERDKLKRSFALKYGYKIFYLWEKEIKNGDFSVIDEILKELKNEI